MPPYTVLPALPTDVEAITDIYFTAFDEHPIMKHKWTGVDPSARRARNLERWGELLARGPELGNRVFKLVDKDG